MSCHVDSDDKTTTLIQGTGTNYKSNAVIINESGLYSLIHSSKLPTAKKIKHWVTSEVLPSLRRTGEYSIKRKPDSYMIDDPVERAKCWIEEYEEKKALEDKINRDKHLVEFANHVSDASNLIDIGTLSRLAKDEQIDIGRSRLFDWLRNSGYLMASSDGWNLPYQKYIEQGLFKVKEYTYKTPYGEKVGTKTYVTGKGKYILLRS